LRRGAVGDFIDARSREDKFLRDCEAMLIEHVGGNPSLVQRVIITRAARVALHLELMDEKSLLKGHGFGIHDHNYYVSWSNSLARLLARLGVIEPTVASQPPMIVPTAEPQPQPQPQTLQDVLRAIAARRSGFQPTEDEHGQPAPSMPALMPAPSVYATEERLPYELRSMRQTKAQIHAMIEAAKRGELPNPPDVRDRYLKKRAALVQLATNGDLARLRAFIIIPNTSTYRRLIRYRDLCIVALEAQQQHARKTAA
jgi:hypothetical protein